MSDPKSFRISNGHLSAQLTDFGASLMDVRFAGDAQGLVLGYPDVCDYARDHQFMGAVIGRYANRIRGGRATISSQEIQLEQNEAGETHLHGGSAGFGRRIWQVKAHSEAAITFALSSPHNEAGFPGELKVFAHYSIIAPHTLRLVLSCISDCDTLVNLCHHPYFNFDGSNAIDAHHLQINAANYLPSDTDLLPTGEVAGVEATCFDYRVPQALVPFDYNHTYCLHNSQVGHLRQAAKIMTQDRSMELWTTQPGLHFYNGYKLKAGPVGHNGVAYGPHSAICLEAQAWPDSPNQAAFPSVELAAGVFYEQRTEYRFSTKNSGEMRAS